MITKNLSSVLSVSVQIVNAKHINTYKKQANNALALLDNVVWSLPLILSPLCVQSSYQVHIIQHTNKYITFTKQEIQVLVKK
jgi:hypothetical protein